MRVHHNSSHAKLCFSTLQINRGFKLRSYADTPEEHAFIGEVEAWLYSFPEDIETEWEENDSLHKLLNFVQRSMLAPNIRASLCMYSEEFISNNFIPQLPYICKRHYMDVWFGWVSETCFVEGVNASLTKDILGPKPQDGIHTAGDKIINHTQESHRRQQSVARKQNNIHITPVKGKKSSEVDLVLEDLSHHIILKLVEVCMNEWHLKDNYRCYVCPQPNIDTSVTIEQPITILVKYAQAAPKKTNHQHPIYRRTRQVVLQQVEINGQSHVTCKCSCSQFLHRQFICRHIYRILSRLPKKLDFLPTGFKTYDVKHGVDMEFTAAVDDAMSHYLHHKASIYPGKLTDIMTCVQNADSNPGFFATSTDKSLDVNPNNHTLDLGDIPRAEVFHGLTGLRKSKPPLPCRAHNLCYPLFQIITENVTDRLRNEAPYC